MHKATIIADNYTGYTAKITFYPLSDPNNPIDLGYRVLPYDYVTNDYYGIYDLYFEEFDSYCSISFLPSI